MLYTLSTVVLLSLWLTMIRPDEVRMRENPFLGLPPFLCGWATSLLRPAFGRRATHEFAAFLLFAFILIFRGALLSATQSAVPLRVGPAVFLPRLDSPGACVCFSVLSFAWTLQALWLVVAYLRLSCGSDGENPVEEVFLTLGVRSSRCPRWFAALVPVVLAAALVRPTTAVCAAPSKDMLLQLLSENALTDPHRLAAAARILPDFAAATPATAAHLVLGSLADLPLHLANLSFAAILLMFLAMLFRPAVFASTMFATAGAATLDMLVSRTFLRRFTRWTLDVRPLVYLLLLQVLVHPLALVAASSLALTVTGLVTPGFFQSLR